ncbi:hypothetical protein EXIGLDRAFT_736912 [Exidia glandulosa HHB12029]|uniref:Uncharacterized protein n=1 Tax=Exidia glandulosa HHB12029 TaxID=1314781 RepID=A0A165J9X6_EXIGL|nr:hypothetical protein EXIGLDRAFT_736912 [Exidia glandulosa HHB12029]
MGPYFTDFRLAPSPSHREIRLPTRSSTPSTLSSSQRVDCDASSSPVCHDASAFTPVHRIASRHTAIQPISSLELPCHTAVSARNARVSVSVFVKRANRLDDVAIRLRVDTSVVSARNIARARLDRPNPSLTRSSTYEVGRALSRSRSSSTGRVHSARRSASMARDSALQGTRSLRRVDRASYHPPRHPAPELDPLQLTRAHKPGRSLSTSRSS